MGTENIVNLKIGEHIIKMRADPDFYPRIGEKLKIKIKEGKMHLFDKKTEENLF